MLRRVLRSISEEDDAPREIGKVFASRAPRLVALHEIFDCYWLILLFSTIYPRLFCFLNIAGEKFYSIENFYLSVKTGCIECIQKIFFLIDSTAGVDNRIISKTRSPIHNQRLLVIFSFPRTDTTSYFTSNKKKRVQSFLTIA